MIPDTTPFLIIILVVYGIYSIVTWFCDILAASSRVLHTNEERVVLGGKVARDAGLLGLTGAERRMVLDFILPFEPYHATKISRRTVIETNESGKCVASDGSTQCMLHGKDDSTTSGDDCESVSISIPAEDYVTCPICLADYEGNDIIMTGKRCKHKFHKVCLLEWLDKHDICPCCRMEMITCDEMREATNRLFDEKRVLAIMMRDQQQQHSANHIDLYPVVPYHNTTHMDDYRAVAGREF